MAYRYGNNYRVAVGAETSYASGKTNVTSIAWTELTVTPDKAEFVFTPNPIETGAKTQVGLSTKCELKQGWDKSTVTISGYLSHEHEYLLKAWTADTTSPYALDGIPTKPSFVVARVWSDAPALTNYTVDIAIGCQLETLNITGTSGDLVRFEAIFTCSSFSRETTQAITGTDPGSNCTEGFNFGDITGTFNFGDTEHLKSFNLSLSDVTADDSSQYQNSLTRLESIITKREGTFNYVTHYTTGGADSTAESYVYGDTSIQERIKLVNTTKIWAIDTTGQVTEYRLADPDKMLFENNVTEKLIYDTTYPLTVTVLAI